MVVEWLRDKIPSLARTLLLAKLPPTSSRELFAAYFPLSFTVLGRDIRLRSLFTDGPALRSSYTFFNSFEWRPCRGEPSACLRKVLPMSDRTV